MRIEYTGGRYIARVTFEERLLPRLAGFTWDAHTKVWFTTSLGVALNLGFQHFTPEARATTGMDGPIPAPEGKEYLPFQDEGIRFALPRSRTLIGDQPGLGKAQPLSAPVLTPRGFRPIGDLQIGDKVIGWWGRPVNVSGIFDRGILPIYHVEFDDGAMVTCSGDHLWTVFTPGEDGGAKETIDTNQLLARVLNREHLAVPTLLEPAMLVPKVFDIAPIVVGADLAYMNGTGPRKYRHAYTEMFDYNIRDYANCAPHQAQEFLHGLIGKIGRIKGDDGHIRFDIINNGCAADIAYTVRSCVQLLGGLVYIEKRTRRLRFRIYLPDHSSYPVFGHITGTRKVRKRWSSFQPGVPARLVVKVTPAGQDHCRCIAIDSADHLYVTNDYVLTHNTIQAVGIMNATPHLENALIIPPASLKKNWLKEIDQWLVNKNLSVDICDGTKNFPNSDIVIINYDILNHHRDKLRERNWQLVIPDEHHFAKNKDSRRTRELHGGVEKIKDPKNKNRSTKVRIDPIPAQKLVMLSGTAMTTKTSDLWTTVRAADPYGLGRDYEEFCKRYCGGYYDLNGFVADGDVSEETRRLLNRLMKERFLIRRLKRDVLSQLPEKIRQIVPLPADGLKKKIAEEKQAMTDLLDMYEKMIGIRKEMSDEDLVKAVFAIRPETWEKYAAMVDGDLATVQMPLTRLANARQDLAISKLPMVTEFVGNLVEQGEKVVIFAYHRAVIQGLMDAFPNSAVIYGDTPMESKRFPERTRMAQQERFQEDKNCRTFIGQYTAAGTGWTLTAARHWVGAELLFVPSDLLQAEDRCHRIGSEIHDSVWAHHLVVEGSLDDTMVLRLIRRMAEIELTLD